MPGYDTPIADLLESGWSSEIPPIPLLVERPAVVSSMEFADLEIVCPHHISAFEIRDRVHFEDLTINRTYNYQVAGAEPETTYARAPTGDDFKTVTNPVLELIDAVIEWIILLQPQR